VRARESASDALDFKSKDCLGMYPQGIHLVHDTWNTVHGERFVLTLIEIAKVQREVDPDRIYTMGFSMGGSGSWFMAGRHPDLLAGSAPCAGVLMAAPKSQVEHKEDVHSIQHGPRAKRSQSRDVLLHRPRRPQLHAGDLPLCLGSAAAAARGRPDRLSEDPVHHVPNLPHTFPPGEPAAGIKWLCDQRRDPFPEKIVWSTRSSPSRSRMPRIVPRAS
jgi:pimeloyl-ACP methyl ester carboxylesterase